VIGKVSTREMIAAVICVRLMQEGLRKEVMISVSTRVRFCYPLLKFLFDCIC